MAAMTREKLARGPGWAERVRRRLPGKLREIPGDLIAPIAAAVLVVFAVDFLVTGEYTVAAVLRKLAAQLVTFLFLFFVGRWNGARLWPKHGSALARRVLRGLVKGDRADLLITGRADIPNSTNRYLYEATALIASVQVLALLVAGVLLRGLLLGLVNVAVFLASVYAALVLVPHWTFARLGLRRVDRARFTVDPATRAYGDRLKISNGAVVLVVLGVGGFVLRQEGLTDVEAGRALVTALVQAVLGTLIVASSAVAFYRRDEARIVEGVAREAMRLGAWDGRGESHEELAARLAARRRSRA